MIVWLLANLCLTTLALVFTISNARAPHRLRFLICFGALSSWIIPWGQIAQWIPDAPFIPALAPAGAHFGLGSSTLGVSDPANWMSTIAAGSGLALFASTILGGLLFAWSGVRYARFVRHMAVGSIAADHLWRRLSCDLPGAGLPERKPELRIQYEIAGAVTTGVRSPTIWIHENLVGHPDLEAALIHEWRHVRNFDNAFLWGITLIERLFWWNPLVRLLAFRARRLQELSCDEACANELVGYRDMLNRLILASSEITGRPCPQTSCIHHSKNFNIQRLRALERRYVMKARHYLSAILLLVGSSISLTWALAQDRSDEPVPSAGCTPLPASSTIEDRLEAIMACTGQDLGPITGFEPGTTLEHAETLYRDMKLYARLIENQFARQEEIIRSLQEELEALQPPQVVENRDPQG